VRQSDPKKAKEEEERRKREKHQLDEEGRMQRLLEEQVARAHKMARTEGDEIDGDGEEEVLGELRREAREEPIKLSLAPTGPTAAAAAGSSGRGSHHGEGRRGEESKGLPKPAVPLFADGDDDGEGKEGLRRTWLGQVSGRVARTALETRFASGGKEHRGGAVITQQLLNYVCCRSKAIKSRQCIPRMPGLFCFCVQSAILGNHITVFTT
jgi:hypothetical protein